MILFPYRGDLDMADPLQISSTTVARLEKHAKPFVDTVDSVINRILDHYENSSGQTSTNDDDDVSAIGSIGNFDPASPPDLTHTKLLSIEFDKKGFPRSSTTWNALLNDAISLAKRNAKSDDHLKRLILVNYVKGRKEDEGYRYLANADLSVQGQDANAAWKATYHIASQLQTTFEVVFTWRNKDGATHPGSTGRFRQKPRVRII
jgi:hypothetical protein